MATGKVEGEAELGEEPEGVLFTADGKTVYVASEANNLVHVIDFETMEVKADIFVGTRPRRFALTRDEKYLWVSANWPARSTSSIPPPTRCLATSCSCPPASGARR